MFQDMQVPVIFGGSTIKRTPRFITISDSYGRTSTTGTSWQVELQNMINCQCYNYFEGSMGIYRKGENNHNALKLLQANASNIQNPESITDIIFGLGINDCVTGSATHEQLESAYDNLISYCKTTYPDATIWFGFIGYSPSISIGTYIDFINVMQQKCAEYSCQYIDGVEYIMHDLTLKQSDKVHPTANGSKKIAEGINLVLHGCLYTYRHMIQTTFKIGSTTSAANMTMMIDGKNSTIWIPQAYDAGTFSFSGADRLKIGEITNPLFKGSVTYYKYVNVWAVDSSYTKEMTSIGLCTLNENIYGLYVRSGSHPITGLQLNDTELDYDTLLV